MTDLTQTLARRLQSGALVVIVQEADEVLARNAAETCARTVDPKPQIAAGSNTEPVDALTGKLSKPRVVVGCDMLAVMGENPAFVRTVREVALQQRPEGEAYGRLILLEHPATKIPPILAGDVDVIRAPLPDAAEIGGELSVFLADNPRAAVTVAPDGTRDALVSAVAGLPRHEVHRLFARCWVETESLDAPWLRREKAARVAQRLAGALTFDDSAASAPDVGGLGGLRDWLRSRRAAFSSPEARAFGLPEPRGLLILGAPGTGKSLTARTIARDWGLPLLRLDAGRLFGSLVGQSEAQTRAAIEAAEASAPCVLWIDEIEKALAGQSGGGGGDSGTSARVFGALLSWLQDKRSPVFVVATANRIAALPPELLRKGRFDEIFYVGLPSAAEREEIARIHLTRRGQDPASAAALAALTEGFSGAEIEQAIIDGMFAAFDAGRTLTTGDLETAARNTVPLSRTMAEELAAIAKWAETRARPASIPTQPADTAPAPSGRECRPADCAAAQGGSRWPATPWSSS